MRRRGIEARTVAEITTMPALVAASISTPKFRTVMLGSMAGLALILAMVGIFSVMAFLVSQLVREIGIKMALGASATNVLHEVLWSGGRLVLAGTVLGLAVAMATVRVLRNFLFGIEIYDVSVVTVGVLLVATVGLAAAYIPARRATLVDPVDALRSE